MGALRNRLIGALFLALMAGSVWMTYAIFAKKFTDYDEVTLRTSKIGLQMPKRADVKYRGVIVGEVLDFKPTEAGADVTLGIYPDQRKAVPADVAGSILPKTLFGEKFVSLESTSGNAETPIAPGAVITRSAVGTEVEQVLSDLFPLLRTLKPEQLNYFLNAMATALDGRGKLLGENLSSLDAYLKRFNPKVGALVEDLRKTATVSDLYADVLPELATTLRNTVATGHTLEEREAELQKLFGEVTAFSATAESFLDANEKNLIRLGEVSQVQLRLFKKYAPQYPCFLKGMYNALPRHDGIFRGHMLHINAELLPNQPRGWDEGDQPVNGLTNSPYCGKLPNPPWDQKNLFPAPPDFNDGVERDTGKDTKRVAPGAGGQGYAGSAAEADMLRTLIAPVVGQDADQVSDLGVLLVAPMARGSEVTVE